MTFTYLQRNIVDNNKVNSVQHWATYSNIKIDGFDSYDYILSPSDNN